MPNDNDVILEIMPKLYNIPPPDGDGHDAFIGEIHEDCPFCSAVLDLPEALRLAVLDLVQALAASL